MQYKFSLCILVLLLLAHLSVSQFAPTWQQSPYIEARTTVIISNGQKTSGTYTFTISFLGTFASPSIALAIPQIRIASNSTLSFNSYHSSPTSSAFTLNLLIPSSTTTIWYMQSRYIVFDTSVLTTEFNTYLTNNKAGSNIATTPNGLYRTDNFAIVLSPTVTKVSTPTCLVFLAGITGTTSDYYQLNLTCSVSTASSATVTATAYPSTIISSLTFYLLIWDTSNLAVKSNYFVDYAIATTYYGTQKTFLSLPYGCLDLSYLGGVSSFSYNNNQDLNVTLNTLTQLVYTSTTSLYNSVPQFQVRLRVCAYSSPYYNTLDGLCYPICPSYTFGNSTSFICSACPTACKTCLNASICTSCSTGFVVVNNSCTCATYTYSSGGTCVSCHYSCLTCAATGQYYNCLTCDSSAFRTAVNVTGFNSQCVCQTNYSDVGVTTCSETCGDGVVISSACDDNNTQSGDGCSSQCAIQSNFTCSKVGSGPSTCFYTGNVSISVVQIMKGEFQNSATIYIKVTPWIDAMKQLSNSVSLTSNATITSANYDTFQNYLMYQVSYSQSLLGQYVRFDLKPTSSGIFSQLPPTNVTVQLFASDGFKLLVYSDLEYSIAISFHYISMIFGYLILASTFLYIFGRLKWVGNLLFFSLQFQYLSMIIIPSFTPILNGFSQIKTILGYNEAMGQERFDLPKYRSFYVLSFSKKYDFNVNIWVALQGIALVMYIIYHITYNRNKLICRKYGGDPDKTYRTTKYGKILQFFDWEFFMYWTFFNMTEQITAMVLFSQSMDPAMYPFIAFNAICIIAAVLPLFIKRKQVKSYTQLLYYADRGSQESLLTFGSIVLMYIFLAISLTITMTIYYLIFILPFCMIIYLFCRKPFQSRWVRAAYFINNFCIIMSLMYNLLITSMEDQVFYLPFGSFAIIMFDWIFNLVVWGRQAYVICKYGGERDLNEFLQSNTKTTSKEEIDFFRQGGNGQMHNSSFLGAIINTNNKKMAEMGGKSTRRPLRRNDPQDEELPSGLREQKREALEKEQQEQREELKKRRQKWLKQQDQIPKDKEIKEKTRHNVDDGFAKKTLTSSRIRSTNDQGLDKSRMKEIDNRTIRYV